MIPSFQRLFLLMCVLLLSTAQSSLTLAKVIVRVSPLTAETKELGFAKINMVSPFYWGEELSDQEKLDLRNKVLEETGKELAIEADDVDSSNSNFFILMSHERRTRQLRIEENLTLLIPAPFMLALSFVVMKTDAFRDFSHMQGMTNGKFIITTLLIELGLIGTSWVSSQAARLGAATWVNSDLTDEYIEVLEVKPHQGYLNKISSAGADLISKVINQYLTMNRAMHEAAAFIALGKFASDMRDMLERERIEREVEEFFRQFRREQHAHPSKPTYSNDPNDPDSTLQPEELLRKYANIANFKDMTIGQLKKLTITDFKRMYHTAAKKYHPDKDRNEDHEKIMRKLNEAWAILQENTVTSRLRAPRGQQQPAAATDPALLGN